MLVLGFQRGPDDARGGVVDEHVERTELRGLRGNPLGRDVPAQEERLRPGRAQLLGGLLGGPVVAEVADRDPRRPSLSEPQRDRLADSTRATGHQDRGAVEAHRRGGSGWSAGAELGISSQPGTSRRARGPSPALPEAWPSLSSSSIFSSAYCLTSWSSGRSSTSSRTRA